MDFFIASSLIFADKVSTNNLRIFKLNFFSKICLFLSFFIDRMGRCCDLSPRKKSEVRALILHTTHSQRKIAELAGVSKSVVNRIKVNLSEEVPLSPKRKGRCGRKRVTTPRDDR